jgi:hypothetical protein
VPAIVCAAARGATGERRRAESVPGVLLVSVRVMAAVYGQVVGSPTQKAVLLAIADRCNDEGYEAWESLPTLARKTELSERAVWEAVSELKRKGFLEVTRRRERRSNIYRVVLSQLQQGRSSCEVAPAASQSRSWRKSSLAAGATQPRTAFKDNPAPAASDPLGTSKTSGTVARARASEAPRAATVGFASIRELAASRACRYKHQPPCVNNIACAERERQLLAAEDAQDVRVG